MTANFAGAIRAIGLRIGGRLKPRENVIRYTRLCNCLLPVMQDIALKFC